MLKIVFLVFALVSTQYSVANEQKMELCRAKLKRANQLEVLYDLDWKPRKMPQVVAGRTYFTMPFDAKEGFAETVNCFLVGGKDQCIDFEIKHWQTGKAVDKWSYCRLKPI